MFEEVFSGYQRLETGKPQNRLHHVLREDAFDQVALAVEKEGQWSFNATEKAEVLRRIRELYNKRSYPEASFEEWHSIPDDIQEETEEIEPVRKRQKTSKRQTLNERTANYADYVKNRVLKELKEERTTTVDLEGSGADSGAGPSTEPKEETGSSSSSSESSSSDSSDSSDESDSSDSSDSEVADSDTEGVEKSKKKDSAREHMNESDEDVEQDSATGKSLHPDAVFAIKKLKEWETGSDTNRTWIRDHYELRKLGYEIADDLETRPHKSIQRQHVITLNSIVHLKILQKDWHAAYKAFSLLIKLPRVDLRGIWPLGIEILTQIRDEARKDTSKGPTAGRQEQIKVRNFYDWITLSYPLYQWTIVTLAPNHGSVFRSGSKTHTPMYRVAALWDLLAEKRYTQLRDSLDEMLLVPPFDQDGVFHYMMILCLLSENADLIYLYETFGSIDDMMERSAEIGDLAEDVSLLASKDSMKSRIFANNSQISSFVEQCESCNFEVPKQLIEQEMENVRMRLSESSPRIDDASMQDNYMVTKPEVCYSFQRGKFSVSKSKADAIPKKYWNRFVFKKAPDGAKPWSREFFFEASGKGPINCLICGSAFLRSQKLESEQHLATHGITPENEREKKTQIHEMYMARMVKSQGTKLPSRKPPVSHKRKIGMSTENPPDLSSSIHNVHPGTELESEEDTSVNVNSEPEISRADNVESDEDIYSNYMPIADPSDEDDMEDDQPEEDYEDNQSNGNSPDVITSKESLPEMDLSEENSPVVNFKYVSIEQSSDGDGDGDDWDDDDESEEESSEEHNLNGKQSNETPYTENTPLATSSIEDLSEEEVREDNYEYSSIENSNYVPIEDPSDEEEDETQEEEVQQEESQEDEVREDVVQQEEVQQEEVQQEEAKEEEAQEQEVQHEEAQEENYENELIENSNYVPPEDSHHEDDWDDDESEVEFSEKNQLDSQSDEPTHSENLPIVTSLDENSQEDEVREDHLPDEISTVEDPSLKTPTENAPDESQEDEKSDQIIQKFESQINENGGIEEHDDTSSMTPLARDSTELDFNLGNTSYSDRADVLERSQEMNIKQEDSATEMEPNTLNHQTESDSNKRATKRRRKRSKSKRKVKAEDPETNPTSPNRCDSVATPSIYEPLLPGTEPSQQSVSIGVSQTLPKVENTDFDCEEENSNANIQNENASLKQTPHVHFDDERSITPAEESLDLMNGTFLHDGIDDSLEFQRNSSSQNTKAGNFEGFSPDTTAENQTFGHDISRVFEQYATQTQESQSRSQSVETQNQLPESGGNHEWRGEFSMDSNFDDSSVNFTRFVTGTALKEDQHKDTIE
ncbi:hypothetical protein JCM33374_g2123 [Metschnikowia sp. JCM 33374]|nr:hypothetical protein JCM33374_g2123 [Metschnikowia sp. JCM 33374]